MSSVWAGVECAHGTTCVLKPDWTSADIAAGTPRIGVDEQGRIVFQTDAGAGQLLLP